MKTKILLAAMMFLQFMMLPVWFVPMFPYVQSLPNGGDWAVWCGMIMGFGTFTSPLFGMFADRYLNAERVLALCNLACAALLAVAYFVTSPAILFVVLLGVMCFYMPTWSLTATIAMAHVARGDFPKIRVFGSLGWVASGAFSFVGVKVFGIVDFDATAWIFAAGALAAFFGAALALVLPATAPSARGTPMSAVDALGLKALVLFKNPTFAVFAILILLAMIPFMWYVVYNPVYLKESGFNYLTATQNLGQAGEILFMLLVPVIVARFGYKRAMVIGLGALAFRYACFYGATRLGWVTLDFGGILVHGLIFGLLVIGSQMFVDDIAPKELRNQAQGLVNLITSGIGVFASNIVFELILRRGLKSDGVCHDWCVPYMTALLLSVVILVLMATLFRPRSRQGAS